MKRKNVFPTILGLALATSLASTSVANALVGDAGVNANIGVGGASSTVTTNAQIQASTSDAILYQTTDASGDTDTNVSANADASSEVTASTENKVTVVYKRPARLFGFIRTYVREEASVEVESDGTRKVDVKKSWWSIFASSETRVDEFKAAIQSRISANASAEAELSASERARLVTEIEAAAVATYE